jgi:hypothetical protein
MADDVSRPSTGTKLTDALTRLVIPVLLKEKIKYESNKEGSTIFFIRKEAEFILQWRVVDYRKMRLLSIEGLNIVAFPPDDPAPNDLATEINRKNAGKFYPNKQGQIVYCLECLYIDETTPELFEDALELAFQIVVNKYADWMRLRWTETPEEDDFTLHLPRNGTQT